MLCGTLFLLVNLDPSGNPILAKYPTFQESSLLIFIFQLNCYLKFSLIESFIDFLKLIASSLEKSLFCKKNCWSQQICKIISTNSSIFWYKNLFSYKISKLYIVHMNGTSSCYWLFLFEVCAEVKPFAIWPDNLKVYNEYL